MQLKEQKNSPMKTWAAIIIFISITGLMSSCKNAAEGDTVSAPRSVMQVNGFKVVAKPFENDIKVTANLLAKEQVELMAPIAGMVLGINFNEGQYVKKGALLVHLDDRAWKAQLVGLKAQLTNAEKDLKRKKALLEIEGSSQEEIDLANTNVSSLQAQIQQLEVNIQLANVRAPFTGQIGMRDFSLGAYLKAGDVLTNLTDVENLKVDFNLPEEYRQSIKIGDQVHLLINGDTIASKVYAVNSVISTQSRTVNVRSRLQQPKKQQIMPGAFAEVLIATNYIKDALLVPSQSIVPEIDKETVYVYKSGKVTRNTIKLGARTDESAHVLEGISVGDTIITTGLLQIREGMDVKLQSIK